MTDSIYIFMFKLYLDLWNQICWNLKNLSISTLFITFVIPLSCLMFSLNVCVQNDKRSTSTHVFLLFIFITYIRNATFSTLLFCIYLWLWAGTHRSSHQRSFIKKTVYKNFTKFTGKDLRPATLLKKMFQRPK